MGFYRYTIQFLTFETEKWVLGKLTGKVFCNEEEGAYCTDHKNILKKIILADNVPTFQLFQSYCITG